MDTDGAGAHGLPTACTHFAHSHPGRSPTANRGGKTEKRPISDMVESRPDRMTG